MSTPDRTPTQQRAAYALAFVCWLFLTYGALALAFALRGQPGP